MLASAIKAKPTAKAEEKVKQTATRQLIEKSGQKSQAQQKKKLHADAKASKMTITTRSRTEKSKANQSLKANTTATVVQLPPSREDESEVSPGSSHYVLCVSQAHTPKSERVIH